MIISLILLFVFTLLGVHYGQIAEPNIIGWGQNLPPGVMGRGLFYETELLFQVVVGLNIFGMALVAWAQERGRKLRTVLSIVFELAVILLVGYYSKYDSAMIMFVVLNPLVLFVWALVLAFMRLHGKQTSKTAYSSKSWSHKL